MFIAFRRAVLGRALPVLPVACLLLALAGCQPSGGAGKGPLAIPGKDTVKILGHRVEQTPDRQLWHWSLIGDRNWTTAASPAPGVLRLHDTYPLNDTARMHGCNTWTVELTAQRTPAAPDTVQWTAILHGSNGSTARTEGKVPLDRALDSTVHADRDGDQTERVPADLTLAHIGQTAISLKIEP